MSRKDIAINARNKFGLAPNFYNAGDIEDLAGIIETSNGRGARPLQYVGDELFTFHPPLDLPPIPINSAVRAADQYGVRRLDLSLSLIRPHIANVLSCHRFEDFLKAPGGNLNYAANPWWATYIMYTATNVTEDNCAYVEYDIHPFMEGIPGLPTILASVNVCFAVNKNGTPSAVFSRVYGDQAQIGFIRLMEHFAFQYGLKIYVTDKWKHNYSNMNSGPLVTDGESESLISIPIEPQITMANRGIGDTETTLVYRYPDLPPVWSINVEGKDHIYELFSAIPVKLNVGARRSNMFSTSAELQAAVSKAGSKGRVSTEKYMGPKLATCHGCGELGDSGDDARDVEIYTGRDDLGYVRARTVCMCYRCTDNKYVYSGQYGVYIEKELAVSVIGADRRHAWILKEDLGDDYIPCDFPNTNESTTYLYHKSLMVPHNRLTVVKGDIKAMAINLPSTWTNEANYRGYSGYTLSGIGNTENIFSRVCQNIVMLFEANEVNTILREKYGLEASIRPVTSVGDHLNWNVSRTKSTVGA